MPRKNAGNLRFTDTELLTWHYRQKFLQYTETEAPEVLESLKELCPQYDAVINHYPYTGTLVAWLRGDYEINDPQVVGLHRRDILDNHLAVKGRYNITDANLLPEAEEIAWKNCIELRDAFADFLEKYGLTPDWFRTGSFRLLGDISRNPKHFNSLCYVYDHAWFPVHGEEIELNIYGWKVEESWQEFETRAREKLEYALKLHKSETINFFRTYKYKQTTKPLSFEMVKWLVLWTVKHTPKEGILKRIKKLRPSTMTIEDLNKDFRRLERKYDLPNRKTKQGKSMAEK